MKEQGPLLSWDVYLTFFDKEIKEANKKTELAILKEYQEKFGWNKSIDVLLKNSDYEALVLTNKLQEIQWVNEGFKKMTGYPTNFIKNKKPKILQGEKTSKTVINKLRSHIQKGEECKGTIINYRKNGEEYNCDIEIYPLKNKNTQVTHFLALEKETKL